MRWHPGLSDLLGRSPEGQRLGLGDEVGHQLVVAVAVLAQGGEHADQVERDEPGPLVEQLVEGVLAVRAGLAPHDRSGVDRHRSAVSGHALAVRLHLELLEVGRELAEVGGVGHHAEALGPEEP